MKKNNNKGRRKFSFSENDHNIFDGRGYRYNVGIVIVNALNEVFWARRSGQNAWQFPQGGMCAGESAREAMWRELTEETGLLPEHVDFLGESRSWLSYRLPVRFRRPKGKGFVQCVGQRQKWYLLRLRDGAEAFVNLKGHDEVEFDRWCWLNYWQAGREVVSFKRGVYCQALQELAHFLPDLEAAPDWFLAGNFKKIADF